MTATTRVPRDQKPISERQENYIARLVSERDLTDAPESVTAALARVADLSNQAAGDLIDAMLALPVPADKTPSEPGFYVHDGKLVKVQANKRGTNTYALVAAIRNGKIRWDYAPDLGRAFGDKPLTVAKARAAVVKAGATKEQAEAGIV